MMLTRGTYRSRNLTPFVAGALSLGLAVGRAEPVADDIVKATRVNHGLVVHVGATDGTLAVGLAKAGPVVVLAVAPDAPAENAVRANLVKAGVHGQATTAMANGGRLPVVDDTAALVVADLDTVTGVTEAELLRVIRPWGTAYVRRGGRWESVAKPRPADVDDWGQYFHDAAMSDLSQDRRAGPAYGLQWVAGPQAKTPEGVRVVGDVCLQLEDGAGEGTTLIARDAFSGLPLWRRPDLSPHTRFGLMLNKEHAYIFPDSPEPGLPGECMMALDARTGRTVREYREGITFPRPDPLPKDRNELRALKETLGNRAKDFQARLTDGGQLLQCAAGELVMVNARNGQRRWAATAGNGLVWMHPLVSAGVVYVVEGRSALSYSYTHWPVAAVERIRAFDAATGKERWTYCWPAERAGIAAYNMVLGQGRLALVSRQGISGKGKLCVLFLDAASGRETAFLDNPPGKREIGGGHSGARGVTVGDKLYLSTIIALPGSVDLFNPEHQDTTYGKLTRPVGCTVYRATPNWIFGSLSVYATQGNQVWHTDVARTSCDVGAFPANGLSYITPNHCFCQPYLPGTMAFHPRPFPGVETFTRLERGPAKPASARTPAGPFSAWPMYLGNNLRAAWVDDPLPATLAPAWSARPAGNDEPHELVARAWAGHWYAQGPVTQASVAEGVLVVALSHRQQVVAYDPVTGTERWRATVDGRVDSAPTIHQGLVLCGTRTGWVYALNRDSGALVWRFFAAPRRERIVVDGQLESPWPVLGTVNADAQGVYAVAGRHTDTDGGLWWHRLDAATGAVLGAGRIGRDELKDRTYGGQNPGQTITTGMTTPAVMSADRFLMAGVHLERKEGQLQPWHGLFELPGEPGLWQSRHDAGILVPGNQGLLNRIENIFGYKLNALSFTQARLYAWKGSDFVMVGGAPLLQHRGGSGGSILRRMRRLDAPKTEMVETKDGKFQRRQSGAEEMWSVPEDLPRGDGLTAVAVAGDAVLTGLTVTNRDRWREKAALAHRLIVRDFADGKERQTLPLPAPPVLGGISTDDGRVFAVCEDGSVVAFAGGPQGQR